MWMQLSAGQQAAQAAAGEQPPCPCLQTPPPLMSPEQTQAVEVAAAADKAMMLGLTRIQEAAVASGQPLIAQLKDM